MRNDSLIGKVHNMFYRYEFQDFFCSGDKQAFFNAGLLVSPSSISRADILTILKYILEDLSFHPIAAPARQLAR